MNGPQSALLSEPAGASSVEALARAVAQAKGGDPLAPVTVIVPSNYSGLSMRRALGRRGGLLNVRFMVENRLAELLGGGRFEGKSGPLTPSLRSEAVRAVLDADPGPFAGVAAHASTARALDATFRELRHASDRELDVLAAASRRATELVRLFRSFRERTALYYDLEDLYFAAALFVEASDGALRDIGHVVLFLPRDQTPGQVALLRAVQQKGRLSIVAGLTGDVDADEDVHDLAKTLTGELLATMAGVDLSQGAEVLTAADADEEVRNVIRLLGRQLDEPGGVRLHRTAVVYPAGSPYAGICAELFAAAGIPVNGPGDRTLAQSLAGRTVLGLLSLPAVEFSRGAVMDFLALPVTLPAGSGRSVQRWDVLSREAGVTRGLANWRMRLNVHAKRLRTDAAAKRAEDRERLADRLDADAAECVELLACLDTLAGDADLSGVDTWPGYAERTVALLDRYIPERQLDDDEAAALQEVRERLMELGGLDALNARCTAEAFQRIAEQQLQAPWGRSGSFDDGVFLAPISQVRGTEFDLVFVLGMVEGVLPRPPREDPLLPDHERGALPSLKRRADARFTRDRADFLSACAAAPRRVLSFPAGDLRNQRKNLPSRWLLDVCSKLAGRQIFTAQFEEMVEHPAGTSWLHAVPSLESGLSSAVPPGNVVEYELRRLIGVDPRDLHRDPLVAGIPPLARGLALTRARRGRDFTEWDGYTGPASLLDVSAEPTSPTRLEAWAACGFRYYLATVLKVQPTREPEDELRMTPLDRGSLMHGILERFFRKYGPAKQPGETWTEAERAGLREMAEEACREAEASGIAGKPLLWRVEKDVLLAELDGVLTADEAIRRQTRARFVEAEFAFGNDRDPFVEVPAGSGVLRFRGKIDRVDRAADGTVIVYDYKTGSDTPYNDMDAGPLGRGRHLQLPVYALAARERFGASEVRAAYWFTRDSAQRNPLHMVFDEDPAEMLGPVLNSMADGIGNGVFPIRPGAFSFGDFANCRFCDYKRLCPVNKGQAWKRKAEAGALAGYMALVEDVATAEEPDGEVDE